MKRWLETIGHGLTVRDVLFYLGLTSVAGASVWLSTATDLIRLFAPWSYLATTLIALALAFIALHLGVTAFRNLTGWEPKPRRREPRLPPHDAPFAQVVDYITNQSRFGSTVAELEMGARLVELEKEIMDTVAARKMHVWGRTGHAPIQSVPSFKWPRVRVDAQGFSIQMAGHDLGRPILVYDVKMNWREVRKAWPPPSLLKRIIR